MIKGVFAPAGNPLGVVVVWDVRRVAVVMLVTEMLRVEMAVVV